MSKTILLIDDDVEIFLDYVVSKLERMGFHIIKAHSLTEAMEALKDPQDIKAAVLDIMFPLEEKDDTIYERYMGRRPTGTADAMQAGRALIPPLMEKAIPILVLTHLTPKTRIGSEVHEKLKRLVKEGKIVRVWLKPPNDSFFNKLEEICAKEESDERKPQ